MKKHVIRMALAGALALGVVSLAKADDAVTAPVWSGLAQETGTQRFATNGNAGGFVAGLQNVRIKGVFGVDADDTVTVQSSLAAQNANGFLLLDAYDTRKISGVWDGLSLKVGQFKVAFGQDGYNNPDQLIRANYSIVDKLLPGNVANEGNAYLVGAEIDQTYSDLTFQLAAVQSTGIGATVPTTGTKFDYVGRAQWKSSNISLGLSDYLQSTNPNLTLNTLGANGSVNVDVFTLDLEAIFGGNNLNGYTGTLSAKFNDIQPAVWYEWGTTSAGTNVTTVGGDDLGAGINLALSAKTRIALDVDFTGANNADILAVNTETVQLQEVF